MSGPIPSRALALSPHHSVSLLVPPPVRLAPARESVFLRAPLSVTHVSLFPPPGARVLNPCDPSAVGRVSSCLHFPWGVLLVSPRRPPRVGLLRRAPRASAAFRGVRALVYSTATGLVRGRRRTSSSCRGVCPFHGALSATVPEESWPLGVHRGGGISSRLVEARAAQRGRRGT